MKIFKAYDIRGIYPDQINEEIIYAIGRAYASFLKPKNVAIGHDVRTSSPSLYASLKSALIDSGVDVFELGPISTEMLYFAVGHYKFDGGITVTASHNPAEYNGMKMVGKSARPISGDTGLKEIEQIATRYLEKMPPTATQKGKIHQQNYFDDYKKFILSFAKNLPFKKLKVVANANFGYQFEFVKKVLAETNIELIPLNANPDGTFPKGRPDPFVPESRDEFLKLIVDKSADFGVAWDADADRCFFATSKGEFIEAYYINAILAKIILQKNPNAKIIYDVRYTWAIIDEVLRAGGQPIEEKVGHSFIKEAMRKNEAIFCGEASGHYYFADFFFADTGILPFIMILDLLSGNEKSLEDITKNLMQKYFISGELNYTVSDADKIISQIDNKFSQEASRVSKLDRLTMEFHREWRFNIRTSNTEPLLRLNIEGKSKKIVEEKKKLLEKIIRKNYSK